MPTFLYEAIDSEGKMVKGTIDAENQRVVLHKLREMKYTVKTITERSSSNVQADILSYLDRFRTVSLQAITLFSRQFAVMINAGLAMVRCLDILSQQTEDKKLQEVLIMVRKDVEGGSTLSNALAKHPNVFSPLYVSMVKAGEMGGVLDTVLNRLATFLEADLKLLKKLQSALTYPVVILVMAMGIVLFLVTYILPTFVELFEGMDLALPLPTRILIGVTKASKNPVAIGITIAVVTILVVVFKQYTKTQTGKLQYDDFKLKVPIFGLMTKKLLYPDFAVLLELF